MMPFRAIENVWQTVIEKISYQIWKIYTFMCIGSGYFYKISVILISKFKSITVVVRLPNILLMKFSFQFISYAYLYLVRLNRKFRTSIHNMWFGNWVEMFIKSNIVLKYLSLPTLSPFNFSAPNHYTRLFSSSICSFICVQCLCAY